MFDSGNHPREAMSTVDTAWLRMERPSNLMMITSIIFFEGPASRARVRETIEARLLSFERFLHRPVETAGGVVWERDRDFDLDAHLRLTALPEPADKEALQDLVGELASTPLPRGRPLWQFHLVENFRGGSALICRIHHCYADGMALVQVLLSMADDRPDAAHHDPPADPKLRAYREGLVERLLRPARAGLGAALGAARQGLGLLRNPRKAGRLALEGADFARELGLALTLSDDPETRFKGPELSSHKRVAWCDPLPLDEVKALARALEVKVNDLLIAAVTGAMRSYLVAVGETPDRRLTIRATVPVNLRPLDHARELGNHFGLVFLDLPIGEPNPFERVRKVHLAMERLKHSKQAAVSLGLLAALGMGPAAVQAPALEMLSRKASTVLTNVPGPDRPLYLAGARIAEQMFWVPQTGNIGLGISILSYAGSVYFGLMSDARLVPDPENIVARFAAEFEQLMLLRLMMPGQGIPSAPRVEELMARWG